jgi:hypothetical protein
MVITVKATNSLGLSVNGGFMLCLCKDCARELASKLNEELEEPCGKIKKYIVCKYIVRICFSDGSRPEYIANGKSYTMQGETFVPFTTDQAKARRFSTYAAAKKASMRRGANMDMGSPEIVEVVE